ncbi:MAG: hypothetical protein GY699_00500 [Desulfobacteraceae bacterium]|nr:hypothetical protein [Desulfobacteraceae bacterium]
MIIGIGYNCAASLTNGTLEFLEQPKAKEIKLYILSTSEAVKLFNASSKKELLSFFHLNC